MTKEEIKEKVVTFLVEDLEIDPAKLKDDARLKEDIGIDSLDFVDIVVLVEKSFGIKIEADKMADVKTLSAFCEYIEKRLNA